MEAEMYWCGIKPTPLGIWNYWDSRFRNSAIGMQQEVAIKSFLSVHPAVVRQDAVYLYGRKYRSVDLINTGIFDRIARSGVIEVHVYVLTMCVRHIWIEVGGTLFELDFVTTQRTVDGDRDISLRDLQSLDALRRKSQTALRNEIPAIHQFHDDRFKEDTGEECKGGVRRIGRPPKSASAQRDADDYDRFRGKAK
ncbi:hypothetical protein EQ845_12215 [Pseudomonas putida]|nr:hypothetical protein EQ845_12215 [Pseudomonas putida]